MPELRARHASRTHYGDTLMKHVAYFLITWSASFGRAACINCTITREEDDEFKNAAWSQIKLITN